MTERNLPTREEVDSYFKDRSNWGRWGKDDEVGAINLITPQKRVAAAGLVRSGRSVSLSRYFPKTPVRKTQPRHNIGCVPYLVVRRVASRQTTMESTTTESPQPSGRSVSCME